MAETRITYMPHGDTSNAVEVAALAHVYSFVIRTSQAKNKAGESDAGKDNAGEVKNACTAKEKHT
jgi:hypothetical protein